MRKFTAVLTAVLCLTACTVPVDDTPVVSGAESPPTTRPRGPAIGDRADVRALEAGTVQLLTYVAAVERLERIAALEYLAEQERQQRAAEAARQRAAAAKAAPTPAPATTHVAAPTAPGSNRELGQQMLLQRHGADQWPCLDRLWSHESGWSTTAANPTSAAYGIPQANPGSKMASHGDDWRTSARTQIAWGLDYIDGRYGTPCAANAFALRNNYY
jgi:hypothetical protein